MWLRVIDMFDVRIGKEFLVDTDGTSDGTQLKYFHDGFWYKEDSAEREGIVEYYVSRLLSFSTLNEKDYVEYEYGKINGKGGCRSKNFLKDDESFITLERLHTNVEGRSVVDAFKPIRTMEKRIDYVLDFVNKVVGLDLYNYFKNVFTLDYITLNEDRHFHNLGIIMDGNQLYRAAPIFDNGKSLLNDNTSRNLNLPISENVTRVVARPFSGLHEAMYRYFGKGFNVDIQSALLWLKDEENNLYKRVLDYRLKTIEF